MIKGHILRRVRIIVVCSLFFLASCNIQFPFNKPAQTPLLYVGHRGFLSALRIKDGSEVWRNAYPANLEGPPYIVQGTVIVTSANRPLFSNGPLAGYVRALDSKTGQLRWQKNLNYASYSAGVVMGNQIIFFQDNATRYVLASFDGNSGKTLWKQFLDNVAIYGIASYHDSIVLLELFEGNAGTSNMIIPDDRFRLEVINSHTGISQWHTEASKMSSLSLSIVGDLALIDQTQSVDNVLKSDILAIGLNDHRTHWQYQVDDQYEVEPFGGYGSTIYALATPDIPGDQNPPPAKVLGLSAKDGSLKWSVPIDTPNQSALIDNDFRNSISCSNGSIYISTSKDTGTKNTNGITLKVYQLSAINGDNGKIKWTTSFDQKQPTMPTVYQGVVYVGTQNFGTSTNSGNVIALDANSGAILWNTEIFGWVNEPVLIA